MANSHFILDLFLLMQGPEAPFQEPGEEAVEEPSGFRSRAPFAAEVRRRGSIWEGVREVQVKVTGETG